MGAGTGGRAGIVLAVAILALVATPAGAGEPAGGPSGFTPLGGAAVKADPRAGGVLVVGEHTAEVAQAVARELTRRGSRALPAVPVAAPEPSAEEVQAAALVGQVEASLRRVEELFYKVQVKAAAGLIVEELDRSTLAIAFAGRFDLLRSLHLWQGICATKLGQSSTARAAFHAAAALDDRALDPTRFPPAIGAAYSAAAGELGARPRGKLAIAVIPASAEIRVDGKPASGRQTLELVQGAHWVEARALGHAPSVRKVVVGASEQRLELRLGVASPAQLQRELHRQQQRGGLEPTRPEVAAALGRLQGVADALVVVERTAGAFAELSFQRIRCSDGQPLDRVVERVPVADRALAVQRALLRIWPVAEPRAPAAGAARPIYKRWWFWALIGGGVAVAGGATALGVVLAKRSNEIVYVAKVATP